MGGEEHVGGREERRRCDHGRFELHHLNLYIVRLALCSSRCSVQKIVIVGRRLEILVITVLGSEDGEGGARSECSEERGMSRGEEGDEEPEEGERRDRSHPPIQRPQD